VIGPLRNEELFATRTLKALDAQDYTLPWEVICVDDRSTDGTPALLKSSLQSILDFPLYMYPLMLHFRRAPRNALWKLVLLSSKI
jgi:glycosyltransferase involved in cell wall biosynthesis